MAAMNDGNSPSPFRRSKRSSPDSKLHPQFYVPEAAESATTRTSQTLESESPAGIGPDPIATPAPIPAGMLFAFAICLICWILGVNLALRPPASAEATVDGLLTLNPARKVVIEPDRVLFQLPIDPAHLERWMRTLNLKSIPASQPFFVPLVHSVERWQEQSSFVRPPFAPGEVNDWWQLNRRQISYGFVREFPDGTFLLLDLESNSLLGWMDPAKLTEWMH